jgi:xanthine dehydrogenase accessory factor
MMKDLSALLRGGQSAVLVTVVSSSGSAPRGAGARMLVDQNGRAAGTVGGGAVEHEAERRAVSALAEGKCDLREYSLTVGDVAALGMACGGAVTLFFQYFRGGDDEAAAQAERLAALLEQGERAFLLLTLTGGGSGSTQIVTPGDGALFSRLEALDKGRGMIDCGEGRTCYAELLSRGGTVYVFGGGHVSQALVPLLSRVDFRCVVLEDRAEFARRALFPDAAGVVLTKLDDFLGRISPTGKDYAVVMTRGHRHDYLVQRQLLKTPVDYIGVMGSRSKKEYVFGRLREDGFTEDDIARIVTPIGLPIGAETPEEIAVSIAAQLIKRRAER